MQEASEQNKCIVRRLRGVRAIALIDLILLVALVSAALTGQKGLVQLLGPLHGINFLILLVVVALGALDGLWSWWFPLAVLLTAGPPGAFLGEWIMQRRVQVRPSVSLSTSTDAGSGARQANPPAERLAVAEEAFGEKRKEQV